jgi:epoxyqueuosine reductase
LELGFDRVAIGPADPPEHGMFFTRWLASGHAGEMAYLERSREKRLDPRKILPGARSVIVVAQHYYQGNPPEAESWRPVSRYAWGKDYHAVMTPTLETLLRYLQEVAGPETHGKVYVDTGPVLERDLAARAGLGWIGKNTMLIHPALGSWFFLGIILTTADLARDEPLADRCGDCTACLDACPTEAFMEPYLLDARRCISYLTIELKGAIPEDLQSQIRKWIFGCDVCQEVCPWNREFPLSRHPAFYPARPFPPLADLLVMEETEFRERFKGSPLLRPKRRGLIRNALASLANRRQAI